MRPDRRRLDDVTCRGCAPRRAPRPHKQVQQPVLRNPATGRGHPPRCAWPASLAAPATPPANRQMPRCPDAAATCRTHRGTASSAFQRRRSATPRTGWTSTSRSQRPAPHVHVPPIHEAGPAPTTLDWRVRHPGWCPLQRQDFRAVPGDSASPHQGIRVLTTVGRCLSISKCRRRAHRMQ